MLSSGTASDATLTSNIVISPYSNGGVSSSNSVSATWRLDALLTSGMNSVGFADSVNIVAAQTLAGGVQNTASFSAGRVITARLQGGPSSTSAASAALVAGSKLQGSASSSTIFTANQLTHPRLQGSVSSGHLLGGNFTTNAFLRQGVESACTFDAGIFTHARLQGAWASSNSLGGDIVQGFVDPLLNNWALEILSATPELSLVTPLKDI
jgi:hypothetical protein